MSYSAIIAKDFGQGTVCVTADTLTGFQSGHGKSSVSLWRKILQLAGHVQHNEPVYVGLINKRDSDYSNKIYELSPVIVDELDIDMVLARDLSKYDLLFFAGTEKNMGDDIKAKIYSYVIGGGGVVVECPTTEGEIEIISDLESVIVDSLQRPTNNRAYWTILGKESSLYTESAYVSIMISMPDNLSEGWTVFMSDVETIYSGEEIPDIIGTTSGLYISTFLVSTGCYFNNGIVEIQEGEESSSSSSAATESESIGNESSSSSSSSQIENWDLCDEILAQWKMNDYAANNILNDSLHNMLNMGYLYEGTVKNDTSKRSVSGVTNRAIYFGGTNEYAKTVSTSNLRFNDGTADEDFSITLWVNIQEGIDGPILCKYESWEIGIMNNGTQLYFKKMDNDGNAITFYGNISVVDLGWNFIAINSYVDGTLQADMVFNRTSVITTITDDGYLGVNTKSNPMLLQQIIRVTHNVP